MNTVQTAFAAPVRPTGARLWIGTILFYLVSAFMVMDIAMHLIRPPFVIEATAKAGIDSSVLLPIGVYELIALVLLITPRLRVLGALLFTAFFGGAAAACLLVSHTPVFMPIVTCVLLWVAVICISPGVSHTLGLEAGQTRSIQQTDDE